MFIAGIRIRDDIRYCVTLLMATNQFDLVVCFERNRPGGPDENTYTARQASALCEW